jgi:hypothetical protein
MTVQNWTGYIRRILEDEKNTLQESRFLKDGDLILYEYATAKFGTTSTRQKKSDMPQRNVIGRQKHDSSRFESLEPFVSQFWREASRQFWRERSCHQRTIEALSPLKHELHRFFKVIKNFPPFITGRLPHS